MDREDMPKLNLSKDAPKLSTSDLFHIKKAEQLNLQRVVRLKQTRKNNYITAGILGLTVFSIYIYTIRAVKQESFLDNFDVPETTSDES